MIIVIDGMDGKVKHRNVEEIQHVSEKKLGISMDENGAKEDDDQNVRR